MAEDDSAKVTYNVGDLLDRMGTRIDTGFATLIEKVDNKADKSDIEAIKTQLHDHGKRIVGLEDRQRIDEAAAAAAEGVRAKAGDWRRWAIGVVVLGACSIPAIIALVIR